MTKTAIYTRVSTIDQADNGYGLEVQIEKCELKAKLKDLEIVATLSDNGISGTKDETERDGLAQLLQMAENKEIDCVIIHSLDRLARKTQIVLDVVEKLKNFGVDLISVKEDLDTSTAQGQFVLTMFAALAQLERDSIVERTTLGRNQRGKVDGERGGSIPYGYVRLTGLIIDEDKAEVVRSIFDKRDNEKWTLTKIADWLNEQGIETSRKGKWYAGTVKVILNNRNKYKGGLRGDSQETWPKIL